MEEQGTLVHLRIEDVVEYGMDARRGNLLGIQPFMLPDDYRSADTFRAKLDGYLDVAARRGWLGERTLVVFPEYVGTWLVVAGEKSRVVHASTIAAAMRTLVLSHPVRFVRTLPSARAQDAVKYSLFRLKAPVMAGIYHAVFSGLAREYGVTIVAGSIVLPSPGISGGELVIGDGELYNVSAVYRPDGSPHEDLVRKVFPIRDELPFTAPASAADLPVFETPAGRLGVLICADSWYPAPYGAIVAQKADFVAVPSYLAPDGIWTQHWRGYDGGPAPDDVDARDIQAIAEGEAWLKYALAGRLPRAGIDHGINVFLRGDLWDLGSDGHTVLVRERAVMEARHVAGAAIVNSWL